jgi:hypothetical protein
VYVQYQPATPLRFRYDMYFINAINKRMHIKHCIVFMFMRRINTIRHIERIEGRKGEIEGYKKGIEYMPLCAVYSIAFFI